jgi:hypothetical protein
VTRRGKWIASALATVALLGAILAAVVVARSRKALDVPPGLVPASWNEFRTSPGHESHVSTGKTTCRDCHDYQRDGFRNPGPLPCTRCHEKQATHSHGSAAEKTDCLTCHLFAPNREAPTCIGCHAQPHGTFAAITQHAKEDCAKCHHLHRDPSIVAADCTECHERERATQHAAHAGSKGCLDCHRAHAPATQAPATCAGCHREPAGPKPAGHDSCFGCHKPHDFVAGGERACVSCHGVKPTLAATRANAQAHAHCISCHTPHAPAQAADSCRGCHAGIQVAHGAKGACVVCHAPHGDDPNVMASTCTSCHKDLGATDTSAHARGVACASCHHPHEFSRKEERTLCSTCHSREITLASTNKGHAACASCHGVSLAHAPARAVACAGCHAPEQATAPPGHAKCVSCHEPHAGARLPQATCASCHANKKGGPHHAIQGGCDTCHRAHGPKGVASPPPCKSCHARESLPALHASSGHADCANCHDAHDAPRSDRATCTGGCHARQRDHQPGAQICSGCHVFRR